MAWLADALPESAGGPLPPALKVAGTNGKGSTAALAAAVLTELGFETGLYTSPHFLEWPERIRIDGEPVGEERLVPALTWFFEAAREYAAEFPGDHVSAFEAATAVALHVYGHLDLDALVVEAGIGGRLDSTWAFPGRRVGLTSIDLEHVELLGRSTIDIALEKAGLCPDGGVLVTGRLPADVLRRLENALALREVEVLAVERQARLHVRRVSASGTVFDLATTPRGWLPDLDMDEVELALPGRHQAENAAVAVLLVREWLAAHGPEVGAHDLEEAVREAWGKIVVPGRFQRLASSGANGSGVWVDAGHTPAALAAVAETSQAAFPEAPVLLVGTSEGRDPAMLEPLLEHARAAVVTHPTERGAEPQPVADVLRGMRPELPVEVHRQPSEALEAACALARRAGCPVLVAGSLFLAGEVAGSGVGSTARG